MKANEAPEKLYITNDEKRFSDKCHSASTEKYVDDDIEYIRADAFIEKACKWLKDNITYIHPRKGTKECIVNLEKFKNYMKGE